MILTDITQLRDIVDQERSNGKKIGFTNGCFDIIHPGHIQTFIEAKKICDILFVGINGDKSPYRNTKPGRPIHDQEHRAIILNSIKYVDYVIFFNEETPIKEIRLIMPDILIKGGDYKQKDVVGYKEVTQNGGAVIIIPLLERYSTSISIEKIMNVSKK